VAFGVRPREEGRRVHLEGVRQVGLRAGESEKERQSQGKCSKKEGGSAQVCKALLD
jgi:hypothetical protein